MQFVANAFCEFRELRSFFTQCDVTSGWLVVFSLWRRVDFFTETDEGRAGIKKGVSRKRENVQYQEVLK